MRRGRSFEPDNRGFSLVELIIVVAIMAILVGVVGTQVIPYMENSKKAKDIQILSAYVTAGMAAYSYHPDSAPTSGTMDVEITSSGGSDVYTCTEAQDIADELSVLMAKDYLTDASNTFQSKTYGVIAKVIVTYDFDNLKIIVKAYDSSDNQIDSESKVEGRL